MKRTSILVALAGFLGFASYPSLGVPIAAWFMYVPFFFALRGKSPRQAFALGLSMALLSWGLITWWFVPAMTRIGEVAWWIAVPLYLFQCFVAALPYGVYGYLQARFRVFSPFHHPVLSTTLFTLLLASFPTVFPGTLAHSQYQYPSLIQVCALGGAGALLFCITLVSVCIYHFLYAALTGSRQVAYRFIAIASVIPLLLYCYGRYTVAQLEVEEPALTPLSLVLIQPHIPVTSGRADKETYLDRITRQTRQAAAEVLQPDLIVWPELPLSFSVVNQPRDHRAINALKREIDIPLLLSAFLYEPSEDEQNVSYYNVVHLIKGSPDNALTYRKNILIPFGEYLPFADIFPFLSDMLPDVRRYTAGEVQEVLPLNERIRIAPVICLEAIFPSFVHSFVERGANVIVNPADDAYFGNTSAAAVHMALAALRSVENRVPFVRVNNSGLTQVYDRLGRERIAEPSLFSEGSYKVQVGVPVSGQSENVHTRFLLLLLSFLILGVLYCLVRRKSR